MILNKSKRTSAFPLFVQLNILPVEHLFIYTVLRVFYIRSGNVGTNDLIYKTSHTENRNFRLPKVKKESFRQALQYIGPKAFNQLPLEIKSCKNVNSFCSMLKKWLMSKPDVSFLTNVVS